MSQDRLTNLDVLRAIAALGVCLFHFNKPNFVGIDAFAWLTQHGHLGVDVFFVISGFIIPFALERNNFRLRDTSTFLVARFLRLYPAYLLAGMAAMGLWYLSAQVPGFRGEAPSYTVRQMMANLCLTCSFQAEPWIIPVFWTLAIEAQYYVVMAASFTALTSKTPWVRYVAISLWIVAPLVIPAGHTVFAWSALFALGILAFLRKKGDLSLPLFMCLVICAAAVHGFTKDWLSAFTGLGTMACILYLPPIRSRALVGIGTISYSLYLLHIPFGGRVIRLAERLPDEPFIRLVAIGLALLVSLIVAALFFRYVEKPSHEASRTVQRKAKALRGQATNEWVAPSECR